MEAYRDQYATLFHAGHGVMVIGISADPDTALASWAHDLGTPVLFASDTAQVVAHAYGAMKEGIRYDRRYVYVIGPDGRVAAKLTPFNELSQDAYTELGKDVAAAAADTTRR